MKNLFFEFPWWVILAMIGGGVGIFIAGNNRLNKLMRLGGIGVVIVAILLGVISYVGKSDGEICVQRTSDLAAAVVAKDWTKMRGLLDGDRVLFGHWSGADTIETGARIAMLAHPLDDVSIASARSERLADGTIRVTFVARGQLSGSTSITNWQIEWVKLPQGWTVTRINPLPSPPPVGDYIIRLTNGQ